MKQGVRILSGIWLCAFALSAVAQGVDQPASGRPQVLTREASNEFALLAMMASNAYVNDPEKIKFPLEKLGWKKVDEGGREVPPGRNSYRVKTFFGRLFSNMEFDIWEDTRSNRTVIAFKGTKEKVDWFSGNMSVGISVPYKSAKKHVQLYREAHPDRQLMLTGHSLGGGLALSSSLWIGVDAGLQHVAKGVRRVG